MPLNERETEDREGISGFGNQRVNIAKHLSKRRMVKYHRWNVKMRMTVSLFLLTTPEAKLTKITKVRASC